MFSYPFRYFDGDQLIVDGLRALPFDEWGQLGLILSIIFVLGFFLDWIEITVISLPLFIPVLLSLDFSTHVGDPAITKVWMASLIALTLQTSFLTPPFGYALFFLKGAAPPGVRLVEIYRGGCANHCGASHRHCAAAVVPDIGNVAAAPHEPGHLIV